jgi:hypothetical protein
MGISSLDTGVPLRRATWTAIGRKIARAPMFFLKEDRDLPARAPHKRLEIPDHSADKVRSADCRAENQHRGDQNDHWIAETDESSID